MEKIKPYTDLRYQVYSLKTDGNLDKPITRPMTRERVYKYYTDCVQCAIVSIDEYGSIVAVIEKNTTLLKIINKRPKIKKCFRR